jgi:hypothetical protein
MRYNEVRYSNFGTRRMTFGRGTAESVWQTVEVEAISRDYAPLEPFEAGADDYVLSVDAELGVVLRLPLDSGARSSTSMRCWTSRSTRPSPEAPSAWSYPGWSSCGWIAEQDHLGQGYLEGMIPCSPWSRSGRC